MYCFENGRFETFYQKYLVAVINNDLLVEGENEL